MFDDDVGGQGKGERKGWGDGVPTRELQKGEIVWRWAATRLFWERE